MANRYFLDAYFYYAHPDYLNNTMQIEKTPKVAVVKEKELIFHDPNQQSLEEFIRMEQFLTFTPITLTNFHNLMNTRKNLMILLLNTKDDLKAPQTRKIRKLFKIPIFQSLMMACWLFHTKNSELIFESTDPHLKVQSAMFHLLVVEFLNLCSPD